MSVTESLCTSVTRRLVMWPEAPTKEEERVSQLHGAAPTHSQLPPQPNVGTVQSPGAPLGSSHVSGGCCLGPRQSLTGDGSDGGWLALPAASQAGDADVVAPARLQSRQVIGAGGGWELLAALGPPWQGQRGVRGAGEGSQGCRGAGQLCSPSARRQSRRYPVLPAPGSQVRRRRCSEASVTWKPLTGRRGTASAAGQRGGR